MTWLDGDMFAQQKRKVVAMEEVKDVRAQDSNKFDDEMEIYNLANTKHRGGGGGFKHSWGIGRAPDAPSWITNSWSVSTSLDYVHAYEVVATPSLKEVLPFRCW